MRALRGYLRGLTTQGLDGEGGNIVGILDLQDDICPHPRRWTSAGTGWRPYPPIYGIIGYHEAGDLERASNFIVNLRTAGKSPHTYAHGFIDQVGLSSGGDPAWVFKQFGRDIIAAAREELFPSLPTP